MTATLDYGNCGTFLIMGNAGFISSTVVRTGFFLGGGLYTVAMRNPKNRIGNCSGRILRILQEVLQGFIGFRV